MRQGCAAWRGLVSGRRATSMVTTRRDEAPAPRWRRASLGRHLCRPRSLGHRRCHRSPRHSHRLRRYLRREATQAGLEAGAEAAALGQSLGASWPAALRGSATRWCRSYRLQIRRAGSAAKRGARFNGESVGGCHTRMEKQMSTGRLAVASQGALLRSPDIRYKHSSCVVRRLTDFELDHHRSAHAS